MIWILALIFVKCIAKLKIIDHCNAIYFLQLLLGGYVAINLIAHTLQTIRSVTCHNHNDTTAPTAFYAGKVEVFTTIMCISKVSITCI